MAELSNKAYLYQSSLDKQYAFGEEELRLDISAKRGSYNVAAKKILVVSSKKLQIEILAGDDWIIEKTAENEPLYLLLKKLNFFNKKRGGNQLDTARSENWAAEPRSISLLKTDASGKASLIFSLPKEPGAVEFRVFFLHARYGYSEHVDILSASVISLLGLGIGLAVMLFFLLGSQAFFIFSLRASRKNEGNRKSQHFLANSYKISEQPREQGFVISLYPLLAVISAFQKFWENRLQAMIFAVPVSVASLSRESKLKQKQKQENLPNTKARNSGLFILGRNVYVYIFFVGSHILQRVAHLLLFSLGLFVFTLLVETQMMLALALGYGFTLVAMLRFATQPLQRETPGREDINSKASKKVSNKVSNIPKQKRFVMGMQAPLLFTLCTAITSFSLFSRNYQQVAWDFILLATKHELSWLFKLLSIFSPIPTLMACFSLSAWAQAWEQGRQSVSGFAEASPLLFGELLSELLSWAILGALLMFFVEAILLYSSSKHKPKPS